jgi:hypothetical protein
MANRSANSTLGLETKLAAREGLAARKKAAPALSLGAATAGVRDGRQGGARPRLPPSAATAGTVPYDSRLGHDKPRARGVA